MDEADDRPQRRKSWKNILHELEKKYDKKYTEALNYIINDEREKAENNLRWLELSKKILESRRKKNNFIIPIIIGFLGLLLLGIGFMPVYSTTVGVTLETKFVALTLAEDLTDGIALEGGKLDIYPVSHIEWEFRNWNEEAAEGAKITVIGGDAVNLGIKELHKSAIITFEKNSDILDITIDHDSVLGNVTINQGQLIVQQFDIDTMINTSMIPTAVTFQSKLPGTSMHCVATNARNFQDNTLSVSQINFNHQVRTGEFESGVLAGNVVFPATGNEFTLKPGNVVDIELKNNAPVTLTLSDDRIILETEANVSELRAGPKMFTGSLMPSWLDYFHKNEKIAFYWTAILWIWGMLWSFKRTIFS